MSLGQYLYATFHDRELVLDTPSACAHALFAGPSACPHLLHVDHVRYFALLPPPPLEGSRVRERVSVISVEYQASAPFSLAKPFGAQSAELHAARADAVAECLNVALAGFECLDLQLTDVGDACGLQIRDAHPPATPLATPELSDPTFVPTITGHEDYYEPSSHLCDMTDPVTTSRGSVTVITYPWVSTDQQSPVTSPIASPISAPRELDAGHLPGHDLGQEGAGATFTSRRAVHASLLTLNLLDLRQRWSARVTGGCVTATKTTTLLQLDQQLEQLQ
jgi:hypothetical protein